MASTGPEVASPYLRVYSPSKLGANDRYVSTRTITHNGTVIAFALRANPVPRFYYAVLDLNQQPDQHPSPGKQTEHKDPLEVNCWPDAPTELEFPYEAKVVGADAAPPFRLPAYDVTGNRMQSRQGSFLNKHRSSTATLTADDVKDFEVVSDGESRIISIATFRSHFDFSDSRGQADTSICSDRAAALRGSIQKYQNSTRAARSLTIRCSATDISLLGSLCLVCSKSVIDGVNTKGSP